MEVFLVWAGTPQVHARMRTKRDDICWRHQTIDNVYFLDGTHSILCAI